MVSINAIRIGFTFQRNLNHRILPKRNLRPSIDVFISIVKFHKILNMIYRHFKTKNILFFNRNTPMEVVSELTMIILRT
jgi:hypothetical protein